MLSCTREAGALTQGDLVRYFRLQEIARLVTQAFKQNVCGFDLLRTQVGAGGASPTSFPVADPGSLAFLVSLVLFFRAGQQVLRLRC